MKLVTVEVRFLSDFGFNSKIGIFKEQREKKYLN